MKLLSTCSTIYKRKDIRIESLSRLLTNKNSIFSGHPRLFLIILLKIMSKPPRCCPVTVVFVCRFMVSQLGTICKLVNIVNNKSETVFQFSKVFFVFIMFIITR